MNHDELQAHLTLHGWVPVSYPTSWVGIICRGWLVHEYIPVSLIHQGVRIAPGCDFDLDPGMQLSWEAIPPAQLQRFFNEIVKKELI